jgi:ribonuclease T1
VVSSRKSRLIPSVVLGVAVILVFVVWKVLTSGSVVNSSGWQLNPTNGSTMRATTGSSRTAAQQVDAETGLPWVEVAALPSQGRAVLALVDKGGPYPYSQDGGTFTNAEKLLPLKAKGFYTEYTVKLPSSSDRGPVRIIVGGKGQWYFWTDDHYASFSRIRR